jgi:hypothetical protein
MNMIPLSLVEKYGISIDLLLVTEMNSIEKDEVVKQGETHNSVELVV